MNRKIVGIALSVLLLGGGAAWWFNVPAQLGWVEARHDGTTLYGNVDIRQVQLGFRVGGRILETKVDEGDSVRAGDLIARLDPQPYKDAVAAAEAQVQSLRATLQKLEAGPREAEIAQARASLAESLADQQNAELAYERTERLRPNGAVSQASLDLATAARDMARARAEVGSGSPQSPGGRDPRGRTSMPPARTCRPLRPIWPPAGHLLRMPSFARRRTGSSCRVSGSPVRSCPRAISSTRFR